MNFLEKIVGNKHQEIIKNRQLNPIVELEKSKYFERKCFFLTKKLKESNTGIIAEFKRKSPSKGVINNQVNIVDVVSNYEKANASGISVLTDVKYFAAKNEDLPKTRKNVSLPILLKDFIIDEYQIIYAKSIGADVILLIAEILSKEKVKSFTKEAKTLGLEVLLEFHDEKELDKVTENIDLIGINNRNLNTFLVDINQSIRLFSEIPKNFIKISESGISKPEDVMFLKKIGFEGFIIGENFMQSINPGESCKKFIKQLNKNI